MSPKYAPTLRTLERTLDLVDPRDDGLRRPRAHARASGPAERFVPYLARDRHEEPHARVRACLRVEHLRYPLDERVLVRKYFDVLVAHEGVEIVDELESATPLDAGRASARPTSDPDGSGPPSSRGSSARRSRATEGTRGSGTSFRCGPRPCGSGMLSSCAMRGPRASARGPAGPRPR